MPRPMRDWSDIPGTRERMAEMRAALPTPVLPANVAVEDRMVPGPDGDPDVLVRLYRPEGLPQGAAALYWIHGGGMVMGNVEMNDPYCANIADKLNVLVASVEYRLAPEHAFPAPLEDCYAGLAWLWRSREEFGLDQDRIAVGGASAGGGLAAGVALAARDRGEVPLCYQLLVYPMLDDRNETRSSYAVTDGRTWNREANDAGWNAYLSGNAGGDGVSPYAAPARATDLTGLPPAYINVGDLDLFVDEDVAYARAMADAGVPVELHIYPGAYHGSNGAVPTSVLSRRWAADELAGLGRALGG
ncbi:MAG: alpha/beta hydrolase fold domain-containing protein [Dehalococcoidia bacterium]|nr:alpha/beta hydrolase fold domain-containing protein [Dehalococcoidia bacterium]